MKAQHENQEIRRLTVEDCMAVQHTLVEAFHSNMPLCLAHNGARENTVGAKTV